MTNAEKIAHVTADGATLLMGLPMWYLPQWRGGLLTSDCRLAQALGQYSQVFGSVEGNTTFYALPDAMRIRSWLDQVPDSFRFCFKVPKEISHARDIRRALAGSAGLLFRNFIDQIQTHAPHKLGVLMLQLPASLGAADLAVLIAVLDDLAAIPGVSWALECRHVSWFDKGQNEQQLLRALADRNMDRVVFDSRGLQRDVSGAEAVLDARGKKPSMPVHPVATGQYPVVRFIGHSTYEENRLYLQQWQQKLAQWQQEGRTPLVFWHTAGNRDVPGFHRWLMDIVWNQTVSWPGEQASGITADLWE
jgi:uncharacterized protein YecE (DUF72 family)